MARSLLIEKLADWLDAAEYDAKVEFSKLIYAKYPDSMRDKGAGTQVILKNIPTEFLLELCEKNKTNTDEMEFWETIA